jgi:DNA-binding SARP family transcriptional activator
VVNFSLPIQDCEDAMITHPQPDRTSSVRAHRAPPLLRISLLGGMALHIGDREIALSNRKARALIAYLAATPGMRETRDRLVGLLWSETEDGKARASLRQLLHSLRDALDKEGVAALSTDNFYVSLDGARFVTDLDCALASIDRGDPAECLIGEPLGADAFLRGYDDIDPSFGSWLTTKRENVRRLLIQRLEARLSETAHDAEATKRIAHALFQIDPTHEIACQHLMRSCVASGNTSGALAVYKQLWTCLEQEYDIEPSAATQELVVAIRSGTYRLPIPDLETHNAMTVPNIEDLDSVVRLAVKLAIAWVTKSEPGATLDASALMRLG